MEMIDCIWQSNLDEFDKIILTIPKEWIQNFNEVMYENDYKLIKCK